MYIYSIVQQTSCQFSVSFCLLFYSTILYVYVYNGLRNFEYYIKFPIYFQAKRQQRKLNFLITQTELYAHFMSKKLVGATQQEQLRILSQLEEEKNPRLASMDDYDPEVVKFKAQQNVLPLPVGSGF